jgi:serine/threonine protein kinase
MGHVYRAVNEDVGRTVAIKVLRSEHATNAPIVERFLREARAANLVRHPNVVDVLDVGRDGDGSPFIVQELLRGEDLSKYVERQGGKLTLEEIEDILLPVIDAVAEAHAHGVVHRDIKPENVFLSQQGKTNQRVPKLLDFGISKVRLPNVRATEVGVMMGTPAYMAPEQIQGSHEADPRCDVWALGIMLFELLAGRLPFEVTDAPQLFVAIATKDVPKLIEIVPSVNRDVSRVCERCLRRNPDDRYPTALELARDLRHVLLEEEIEPTQKFSLPPASLGTPPSSGGGGLVIPDLELPANMHSKPAALPTLPHSPSALALNKTEIAPSRPVAQKPSSGGATAYLSTSPRFSDFDDDLDDIPPDAPSGKPPSAPSLPTAPATPSGSSSRLASDQSMSGVMLGPESLSLQRRPPPQPYLDIQHRSSAAQGPDLSFLIGLSVVGLVAIGATAALMTFAHQPDGFSLVALVTKPTKELNLVVHGGGAVAALVFAIRTGMGAMKKWRGALDGGRMGAVISSAFAGAFFFAAIELARAAF